MYLITRIAVVAAAICALSAGTGAAAPPITPYLPPEAARAGDDGWEAYKDAPIVDSAGAEQVNPPPNTPEAAVVNFLASRARGDEEWKKIMVTALSDRAERQLEQWDDWTLERFQLRARKKQGADNVSIRVFFEISFDGRSEEGEDEFEVVPDGDIWRVASVPA